ncbi:MAG TPA: glycerol-3-phosphate dehydrogenase/oxidase, partial [Thermoanaerobaculia bacterium]|nr:glycerol-3-phosphate dehydrogenase/oxidase [Thermoanaerobaculia bacterium]
MTQAAGFQPRAERLAALESRSFDALVIGGGITGAAAARDAAARGLSVAALEREDWASGTSWRSSKLIHGGLRYLETGEARLVFESLSERARLIRLAPHLVEPLDFLFPSYRGRGIAPWLRELGLTAYDLLALGRSPSWHRRLSKEELLKRERLLESPELLSGAVYSDARTDDARLTLENVLDAVVLGAVAVSRVEVAALEKDASGKIRGVRARDRESGRLLSVAASVVINATGPWGDLVLRLDAGEAPPRLRLSRGVHLTLPASRLPLQSTVAFPMEDGRLLFGIPYWPVTLLGTTDTDYAGSPDEVTADAEDVRYLLDAASRTFPSARLSKADVLSTFAGLRPLVREPGKSLEETSREEALTVSASGLVNVTGGKLTTHRRMGAKAVDRAARVLRRQGRAVPDSATSSRRFPGAPDMPMKEFRRLFVGVATSLNPDLGKEAAGHLACRYGSRASEVVALTAGDRALGRPIVEGLPDIDAEIVFAARFEDARSLSDALIRRTHLFW